MNEIKITTEYIKLDQLIKFAGLSFDGAEAKDMIKSGIVFVNGEKEERRGRKIYSEDEILIKFEDEDFYMKVVK